MISYFAIAVSIISLGLSFYVLTAQSVYSIDYMGLVVSALSVLITFLLGWNIYQLIDIRQVKEQIQKNVNERLRGIMASMHYNSFLAFKDKSNIGATTSLVLCLNELLKNADDEVDNIERAIRELNDSFAKLKDGDMFGENNRKILFRIIREIKKNKSYKTEELDDIISQIKKRLDTEERR